MLTVEFEVTGMTCAHCEHAVEAEVRRIPGVRSVEVHAASGRLVVASEPAVESEAVIEAVGDAGYDVAGPHGATSV